MIADWKSRARKLIQAARSQEQDGKGLVHADTATMLQMHAAPRQAAYNENRMYDPSTFFLYFLPHFSTMACPSETRSGATTSHLPHSSSHGKPSYARVSAVWKPACRAPAVSQA